MNYIRAFINNVSFPKTIEELERYIYDKKMYDMEDLLLSCKIGFNAGWTVPRNCSQGDIVLFFHAKTAIQTIARLHTFVKNNKNIENYHDLDEWLIKARSIYSIYGGKIFAIGTIKGRPEYDHDDFCDNEKHWGSRIYAEIENMFLLENPIDINEFNNFLKISRQSGITFVPSKEFELLKGLIIKKNKVKDFFLECKIGNINFKDINVNNFIEKTSLFRTRFLLESYFRSSYVDYFLKVLAGKSVWSESQCRINDSNHIDFVDNVIKYKNKYLLFECKLNVLLEKDITKQLTKYLDCDYICLNKNKIITQFEKNYCFVIDMFSVYLFNKSERIITKVLNLDNLHSNAQIKELIDECIKK